ncbi:hypothetical protein OAS39_12750 [Pirellulales bacterium]|nr:hypothetical protein [Pirellulales bacterium]
MDRIKPKTSGFKSVRLLTAFGFLTFLGCYNQTVRVIHPELDTLAAAHEAIELYDKDGNKSLSKAELSASPALLGAFKKYDGNGDSQLQVDEISQSLAAWAGDGLAMTPCRCTVRLNGKLLHGARVRFIPEPFLASVLKEASGVTNSRGLTLVTTPDEQLPEANQGLGAIYVGLYRIEVTHPSVEIPARFNSESILGDEMLGQYALTSMPINLSTSNSKGKKEGIGNVVDPLALP